jgi:hypothetical protein
MSIYKIGNPGNPAGSYFLPNLCVNYDQQLKYFMLQWNDQVVIKPVDFVFLVIFSEIISH